LCNRLFKSLSRAKESAAPRHGLCRSQICIALRIGGCDDDVHSAESLILKNSEGVSATEDKVSVPSSNEVFRLPKIDF
jgi:hypothetical protein